MSLGPRESSSRRVTENPGSDVLHVFKPAADFADGELDEILKRLPLLAYSGVEVLRGSVVCRLSNTFDRTIYPHDGGGQAVVGIKPDPAPTRSRCISRS